VRQPAPLCRAATVQPVFELCIDLGEGNGVVEGELTPLFTRSELVSVRYQVPFALEASADKGVVRIDTAGLGLLAGDVLRACSTLEMRYDSETRTVRLGPGFHGRKRALGQEGEVASRSGARWWERKLRRSVPSALDELGVFIETCPAKVLFIADGQSFAKARGRPLLRSSSRSARSPHAAWPAHRACHSVFSSVLRRWRTRSRPTFPRRPRT